MNPAPTNRSTNIGFLLIGLFGLPFAAFGLFALSQALRLVGAPAGSPPFWYPLMFGVIFSGVGFGLMLLALTGRKSYARQQNLQAEHPAEPWLWRADWAAGRVKSKTEGTMIGSWVGTIVWNLISWPVAIFVVPAAVKQKGPVAYIALFFPAIGILLLISAVRQTMAFWEFGKTFFEMSSVPGVVGRELKGSIQARFPHSPDHGVNLRLSSVHRYITGSGNNQMTHEDILWRTEAELNSGQLCPGPAGTTIPVAFHFPVDAQPTEKVNPRDEFLWLLEATANVPGVDYHDVFEVPVFRTKDTPQAEVASEEIAFGVQASEAPLPGQMSVHVRQIVEGTEFYFPAARNKGFAMSITVFAAIFSAITYFLVHAPVLFVLPAGFGFFSVLLAYIAAQMWLGTTRIVIGKSMTLQPGLLGAGRSREIGFSEISAITDKIAAQIGGGTGTPFYDIEMTLQDGRKLTLGRTLRDKHETEWLVSEMRRLAGLDNKKSMTAGTA